MITQLKPLLFTVLVLICLNLSAQEQDDFKERYYQPDFENLDQFAKEVYGQKANALVLQNDYKLKFYKDLFTNRLKIVKLEQDPNIYEYLTEVPVYNKELIQPNGQFEPTKFNPLNYKLNYFNKDDKVFYRAYNTNYYIVIEKFNPTKIQ